MRTENYRLKTESEILGLEISSLANLNEEIDELFVELEKSGDPSSLEELCPYFGVVWPSARGLAEHLVAINEVGRGGLKGTTVLEIGCGLGLPSMAAARLGAEVVASDFHPDIPWFLDRNIAQNAIKGLQYVRRDWRANREPLGGFDWVVGSDILYERQHPAPVARVLASHVVPGGRVVLADPGRPYLQAFADEMKTLGFRCEVHTRNVADGAQRKDIFVLEFTSVLSLKRFDKM